MKSPTTHHQRTSKFWTWRTTTTAAMPCGPIAQAFLAIFVALLMILCTSSPYQDNSCWLSGPFVQATSNSSGDNRRESPSLLDSTPATNHTHHHNNNKPTATTATVPTSQQHTLQDTNTNSTGEQQPQEQQQQQHRLSCQPGEQRQFSYESSTRVWGSTEQQVRLRATLRLKCMEPPTNTTLKYLAEIVSLTPNFVHQNEIVGQKLQQATVQVANGGKRPAFKQNGAGSLTYPTVYSTDQTNLKAEPLLEEVGQAATRAGRSLSGWFSKAWLSVRDFFGNIFTTTERSSVSRDQAFKESGLDIMGQCKAPSSSSKGRHPAGLPFDESVFEDLGPEYYIGASLDGSMGAGSNGLGGYFEHSTGDHTTSDTLGQPPSSSAGRTPLRPTTGAATADDEQDELSMSLSFFDDPVLAGRASTGSSGTGSSRTKRAAGHHSSKSTRSAMLGGSGSSGDSSTSNDYNKLIRIPFVFVQSRAGKIIEIRFSGDELDLSVKNFKRHLCDLFATNLDWNRTSQNEVSPIGKHQTKYQLDSSANSIDSIKESALKLATNNNDEERSNKQQLVRVLATMVGTNDRSLVKDVGAADGNGTNKTLVDLDDDDDDGHVNDHEHDQDYLDPTVPAADDGRRNSTKRGPGGAIAVLRTINTTSSIQLSSKMFAPDIDRIQVRVKQVQQINGGRLVGTAGQLSMSLMLMQQQQQSSSGGAGSGRSKRETATTTNSYDDEQSKSHEQVDDISDLLRVSTSFSMQLVPIPRNPDGSIDDETPSKSTGRSATSRRWQRSVSNGSPEPKGHHNRKKARKSAALVRQPPSDPQELQRVLQEWRKQEVRLQLSPSNLVAENNGQQESQQTRLDILRDQIRQRLNEEYVTNRIRRSLTQQQQQLAAAAAVSSGPLVTPSQQQARGGDGQDSQTSDSEPSSSSAPKSSGAGGDLGLGLTQLVIGSGVTTKRKGSIYSTIEEAMELETNLVSDQNDPMAISKLLRETIRMDKLKQHCKSSIPSIEELGDADSSHYHRKRVSGVSKLQIERRLPFGFKATSDYYDDDATSDNADDDDLAEDQREHKSRSHELREDTTSTANRAAAKKSKRRLKTRSLVDQFERQNDKRLEQCQNVLQLMLKLNDRQAIELVIDLIDECNQRLLAAAKREELGYGPMSKLYRRLRKRFIELLVHTSRPSDSLMDKLLARLYYPKMSLESTNNNNNGGKYQHRSSSSHNQGTGSRGSPPHQHTTPEPAEFVYVNQRATKDGGTKYNKSLLKDEDDFNNNDGAALLVMTITSLAAKSSVSRTKRVELTERLLQSLKGTTCSLFNTPDLDIIESMANFQEPLDEIVGRILQLARRCKQHDQYVVACIHGLSGQLQHSGTQRFLIDLLKSQNSSCTIKSEIVLTLIGAQLANDLKQFTSSPLSVGSGQEQRASNNNSNNQSSAHGSTRPTATSTASQWPNSGLNKVDETLLELLDGTERQREPDRRCLKQLVGYYLSKKHQTVQSSGSGAAGSSGSGPNSSGSGGKQQRSGRSHNQQQQQHSRHLNQLDQAAAARGGAPRRHGKRAVMNEQNFWDEAQCKRWSVPADGQFDLSTIFGPAANQSNFYTAQSPPSPNHHDLIDEIDDNSIITALMSSHNNNNNKSSARSGRRNQKLIERELDANSNSSTSSTSSSSGSAGGGASSTMAGGGGGHTAGGQSSSQATNTYLRRRHKCVASKDFGPKSAQANLKAEIVNDLIGSMDENKFLARFRLSTNFLGNRIDVGRMYLWHQRRTTRAYANILGRSIWDSSHGCKDKAPNQVLYMPLFDFNLWLVKVSVGLRLNAEMGFFPNCDQQQQKATSNTTSSAISNEGDHLPSARVELKQSSSGHNDELQLYPSITLKAAGEATARLVVARAGMSLASQYSYQGDIRVSRQPESCMSVYSSHQPMNITFSSWFQLWDNDCHFWGSRGRAEPQAIKWRLMARKPTVWLEDECLAAGLTVPGRSNSTMANDQKTPTDRTAGAATPLSARTIATANRIDP